MKIFLVPKYESLEIEQLECSRLIQVYKALSSFLLEYNFMPLSNLYSNNAPII